jgi:hypothetical protein
MRPVLVGFIFALALVPAAQAEPRPQAQPQKQNLVIAGNGPSATPQGYYPVAPLSSTGTIRILSWEEMREEAAWRQETAELLRQLLRK